MCACVYVLACVCKAPNCPYIKRRGRKVNVQAPNNEGIIEKDRAGRANGEE